MRFLLGSSAAVWLGLVLFSSTSSGGILPYATRMRPYSPWTAGTRGDIKTIGMGGSSVALPASISAAAANPAGYGLLTGSVSAQIASVSFDDAQIQRSGEPIEANYFGLGVSPEPWGFAFSSYAPLYESGIFVSPNTGDLLDGEIALREFRFTVARSLLDGDVAIGASLHLLRAFREINGFSATSWGVGMQAGLLWRLPSHVVFGASYAPEARVHPSGGADPQVILPGFNQTVVRPSQFRAGLGWLPNRYFSASFELGRIGATDGTALLADERISVGAEPTWVPRIGASYVLLEYESFKLESTMGAYWEKTRVADQNSRLHFTTGLEANPSFVNVGVAMDVSSAYRNLIFSVGIDIVRTARFFAIIPKDPVPPLNGRFPRILDLSSEGLPPQIAPPDSASAAEAANVDLKDAAKAIEEAPQNLLNKAMGKPTSVEVRERKVRRRAKARAAAKASPTASPSPAAKP